MATENRNLIAGIKQFDGKGFYAWKIRIRAALEEIGVLKVISDDFEAMSDKTFNQANKKAKNVIIQNLHDRILHSVHDKEKAKDIMDCLEKTYARSGLSEQIELKGKLNNMKFKNGALAEYFEEFDRVVTDLANAGGNLTDQEIVAILLSGMPRSYNSVTASLDIFSSETEFDIHYLRCNLLSVPKMINSGLEIIFKDSKVFVLNKKKQVFLEGQKKGMMLKITFQVRDFNKNSALKAYVFVLNKKKQVFLEGQKKGMMLKITFQVRDFNKNSALKAYSICNDHMLWHRRLGHASAGKLKIMLEKNLISIDKNLSKNEIFCEPCVKGRQTKDYCAKY
ncbi:GAG-pre-integrase domain [Popillia japonica]|uniref:GAG-pre-integrase domain n=1 Tax=Popillia japonica TaxID=7064 RepID=A0AAW1LSR9_POPJA